MENKNYSLRGKGKKPNYAGKKDEKIYHHHLKKHCDFQPHCWDPDCISQCRKKTELYRPLVIASLNKTTITLYYRHLSRAFHHLLHFLLWQRQVRWWCQFCKGSPSDVKCVCLRLSLPSRSQSPCYSTFSHALFMDSKATHVYGVYHYRPTCCHPGQTAHPMSAVLCCCAYDPQDKAWSKTRERLSSVLIVPRSQLIIQMRS